MGMRVGGAASSAAMSSWQTRQQDFGNLVSAIKSGNLTSAQQAFSALQTLSGSASTGAGTGTTTGTTTTTGGTSNSSPLAAIGQALASGDIGAAQQALANAFNGSGGGHHHHHHGGGGASTGTAATTALPAGTTVSTMA